MNKQDLFAKIDNEITKGDLYICISGYSCSGKTTLAKEISERYSYLKPLVLCEDMWYKDLSDIQRNAQGYYDMESPTAFHISEFVMDVEKLADLGYCYVPNYKIETNTRIDKNKKVTKSPLTILDGLHTVGLFTGFDESHNFIYILVDTDIDTCITRRVDRDVSWSNLSASRIKEHYRNVIEPNYNGCYNRLRSVIKEKGERGVLLK